MNDVLGYGGLDEGDSVELGQELDEPTEISFSGWAEGDGAGVLRGECVEEPGDKDFGTGGALGSIEDLAEEALERMVSNTTPIQVIMVVGP